MSRSRYAPQSTKEMCRVCGYRLDSRGHMQECRNKPGAHESSGAVSKARAGQGLPSESWDADRAIDGLRAILDEVYGARSRSI